MSSSAYQSPQSKSIGYSDGDVDDGAKNKASNGFTLAVAHSLFMTKPPSTGLPLVIFPSLAKKTRGHHQPTNHAACTLKIKSEFQNVPR